MFAWFRRAASRASLTNISRRSESSDRFVFRNFRTTSLLTPCEPLITARKTCAVPPCPSSSKRRYRSGVSPLILPSLDSILGIRLHARPFRINVKEHETRRASRFGENGDQCATTTLPPTPDSYRNEGGRV